MVVTPPPEMTDQQIEAAAREIRNQRGDAVLIQFTELLFVAVPILVFSLVFWQKNTFYSFWEMPEWSFAATILFGQTLTKLVSGALAGPRGLRPARLGFLVTILIVFAIISSAVLLLVLTQTIGASGQQPLSRGLMIAQFVVLFIAIVSFLIIGGSAELNRMRHEASAVLGD
jgi:hypothetical protein